MQSPRKSALLAPQAVNTFWKNNAFGEPLGEILGLEVECRSLRAIHLHRVAAVLMYNFPATVPPLQDNSAAVPNVDWSLFLLLSAHPAETVNNGEVAINDHCGVFKLDRDAIHPGAEPGVPNLLCGGRRFHGILTAAAGRR